MNFWSVGGKIPIELWTNPLECFRDLGFTVDPQETHIRFRAFI